MHTTNLLMSQINNIESYILATVVLHICYMFWLFINWQVRPELWHTCFKTKYVWGRTGFEEEVLNSAVAWPPLWLRYVDDTFVIWPHRTGRLEEFHATWTASEGASSSYWNRMRTTAFCSLMCWWQERQPGDHLHSVLEENSNRLISSLSVTCTHHHPRVKSGIISCLRTRAETVCSEHIIASKKKQLCDILVASGYLEEMTNKFMSKSDRPSSSEQQERTDTLCLPSLVPSLFPPYIRGLSESVEKLYLYCGWHISTNRNANLWEIHLLLRFL